MDVLPAETGRIDLADKLRKGTVQLTTDMTGVPPAKVGSPPTPYGSTASAADATSTAYWSKAEGAVDGSSAFWSGALSSRADGTGTYTLKLDEQYSLTRLGLGLLPGAAATARVATSTDGTTWTPATLAYPAGVPSAAETGLVSTPGDRGTRYYGLNATAQYVRITTGATSCTTIGEPGSCSMINELELDSTTDSFENEAGVPRGFAETACARITQPAGTADPTHDSQYAVRLKDAGGSDNSYCDGETTQARLTYPAAGAPLPVRTSRTLRAGVFPNGIANSILFDIDGSRTSDGATVLAYHFGISNNAANNWMYDAGGGKWTVFTGGPAVPQRQWTSFRVVASTTGAVLYATDAQHNEVKVGDLPKLGDPINNIKGYTVASAGTGTVGDEAVLDDLSFE